MFRKDTESILMVTRNAIESLQIMLWVDSAEGGKEGPFQAPLEAERAGALVNGFLAGHLRND